VRQALAHADWQSDLVTEEIEVLRLVGPHQEVRGVNHQAQVQPLHLYADRQPAPYQDAAKAQTEKASLTQHYVRIRTRGGQEGR
jgi:hypothetical protein